MVAITSQQSRFALVFQRLRGGPVPSPRERHSVIIYEPGLAPVPAGKDGSFEHVLLPLIRIWVSSTSITSMRD